MNSRDRARKAQKGKDGLSASSLPSPTSSGAAFQYVPKFRGTRQLEAESVRLGQELNNERREVSPNSRLASDDARYWPTKGLTLTAYVHWNIMSAVEHLRYVESALSGRDPSPLAHFTALRGSLQASATAIRIMAEEDEDQRRLLGLRFLKDDMTYARAWFKMHKSQLTPSDFHSGLRDANAEIEEAKARLKALHDESKGDRPNETGVIRNAGKVVELRLGLVDHADRIEALWNILSGYAHSTMWSISTFAAGGMEQGLELDKKFLMVCRDLVIQQRDVALQLWDENRSD